MSAHDLLRGVAERGSPLISADELEAIIALPSVKLFDVRGTWSDPPRAQPAEFEEGHIPGASFLDWTKYFIEQDVPLGEASVSDIERARLSFKELGISDGDLVVVYDNTSHMMAGRMWWAMRYWGFDNVRVLNGGLKNWTVSGRSLSTTPQRIAAEGTFEPKEHADIRVSLDAFLATRESHCVIDGRGAAGYAGKKDDPRTGHIPLSVSVPFDAVLSEQSGEFLDPASIKGTFDKRAPKWRDDPVIASCGAGYSATVILLALAQIDHPARLFDGSFAAWKKDPNRPVEQTNPT